MAGIATSTAAGPRRTAKGSSPVSATVATTAGTPTAGAAPSRPAARSRARTGIVRKYSGRSVSSLPPSRIGPSSQPSVQPAKARPSRPVEVLRPVELQPAEPVRAERGKQPEQSAEDHPPGPPTGQRVPQDGQLHSDQDTNHDNPSAPPVRPPTMCTNASSRLCSPRTSATGPAATIRPAASTATWSHIASTSAIT